MAEQALIVVELWSALQSLNSTTPCKAEAIKTILRLASTSGPVGERAQKALKDYLDCQFVTNL